MTFSKFRRSLCDSKRLIRGSQVLTVVLLMTGRCCEPGLTVRVKQEGDLEEEKLTCLFQHDIIFSHATFPPHTFRHNDWGQSTFVPLGDDVHHTALYVYLSLHEPPHYFPHLYLNYRAYRAILGPTLRTLIHTLFSRLSAHLPLTVN